MGIIQGGRTIEEAIPRPIWPFGNIRLVPSGTTIQSVVDVAEAGDIIYIEAGTYAENVIIATAGLTLVGLGARGQPWINPAAGGGLQIDEVDDIVIINLGIAGAAAADWAMNAQSASECRFYQCKFEGPTGTVVLLDGTAGAQCGNLLFDDCEFANGGSGVLFDNSGFGYPTQMRFRNCLFHNLTAVCMGLDTDGGVLDLWVKGCEFGTAEDGTEPTDFILIARAGDTGMFTDNSFATATNAASLLTIAAGIHWVANKTEAGVSTARPA